MKVVLSSRAQNDLRDIGRFIAQENPPRADSFTRELQHAAKALGQWPERFPIVTDFPNLEVRRRNYGNYAIFYYVSPSYVTVLRFLHSARDPSSILD